MKISTTVNLAGVYQRLSALGFVFNTESRYWTRGRDDAAISDESIVDITTHWPQFVEPALGILERHPSFVVTCNVDHDTNIMTVRVAPEAADRGDDE